VLQGWSKNNFSGRLIGVGFLAGFGLAAAWGAHFLFVAHRGTLR
jgi:hypothetical protein